MESTMKLLFEKSIPGRRTKYLSKCDVPIRTLPAGMERVLPPRFPELVETNISRHYSALESRTFGVNDGFYPLGSCTMKYDPKINEKVSALAGFTELHPLQPLDGVQVILEALYLSEQYLTEITGMDKMSFQPSAGAHGEFVGLLLIKKYHENRDDTARTKVIVPDSAHGTNPATVSICGMSVVKVASNADGCKDSFGNVLGFYGNILVVLRALAYIMTLSSDGLPEMSKHAVLNANYLKHLLSVHFEIVNKGLCMHEFIVTMEKEAKEKNVTAKDMPKALLDNSMMSPTMYFPLIVKEALMVEPTETEGKETLDYVVETYIRLYEEVMANPEAAHLLPKNTIIGRPDEVEAARNPIVCYKWEA